MFATSFISVLFLINNLIMITSSSSTKIIINKERAIALHQIGLYSQQVEESMLHIFISLDDHCVHFPSSNVCKYTESNPDIIEIGTMLPPHHAIPPLYNKANISSIISVGIRQIFYNHQVEKFIRKAKSIVYFVDNNFYIPENINKITSSTSAKGWARSPDSTCIMNFSLLKRMFRNLSLC